MVKVSSEAYVFLFCILMLAWPFLFGSEPMMFWPILIANTGIFITVVYFTSGRRCDFFTGLSLLCEPYMSGCANITIIYIFPIILFYYIRMIGATWEGVRGKEGESFEGIRRGKGYTESWWADFVSDRSR
jgi:hypothetical protein